MEVRPWPQHFRSHVQGQPEVELDLPVLRPAHHADESSEKAAYTCQADRKVDLQCQVLLCGKSLQVWTDAWCGLCRFVRVVRLDHQEHRGWGGLVCLPPGQPRDLPREDSSKEP